MKCCSEMGSLPRLSFEAQFAANPDIMGLYARLTSRPTPTSIGHLVASREVGMLRALMWCGSAGDHSCGVFQDRDGHLVEDEII